MAKYSHTAILAQSLGIPAVTRILHATSHIHPGMQLLVDGQAGSVTVAPSKSDENSFVQQKRKYESLVASTTAKENVPCTTQDGIEISLLANIGLPEDAELIRSAKDQIHVR